MSDDVVGLGIKIPRSVHEKATRDAKARGVSLKEHIIALVEDDKPVTENGLPREVIELLSRTRDSKRFGPETILEEILRRIISMQIQSVDGLRVEVGKEEIQDKIDHYDSMTEQVVNRT